MSDPLDHEADAGLLVAPGAPDGRDAGGGGEDARHAAPHLHHAWGHISTIVIVSHQELETNLREDFTITEKAPTRASF